MPNTYTVTTERVTWVATGCIFSMHVMWSKRVQVETGDQCTVWRQADWRTECSAVVAAVCGMHQSVAAASAGHTDSSPDDDCARRPAAAIAGLQHTAIHNYTAVSHASGLSYQ